MMLRGDLFASTHPKHSLATPCMLPSHNPQGPHIMYDTARHACGVVVDTTSHHSLFTDKSNRPCQNPRRARRAASRTHGTRIARCPNTAAIKTSRASISLCPLFYTLTTRLHIVHLHLRQAYRKAFSIIAASQANFGEQSNAKQKQKRRRKAGGACPMPRATSHQPSHKAPSRVSTPATSS